jgi:uncharacterized protein YbgA (DUF1722 family)
MQALRRCASRGTHGNVLQHLSGYLRNGLDQADKAELQQSSASTSKAWCRWWCR